jgi:hypothetical protein
LETFITLSENSKTVQYKSNFRPSRRNRAREKQNKKKPQEKKKKNTKITEKRKPEQKIQFKYCC